MILENINYEIYGHHKRYKDMLFNDAVSRLDCVAPVIDGGMGMGFGG